MTKTTYTVSGKFDGRDVSVTNFEGYNEAFGYAWRKGWTDYKVIRSRVPV